MPVALVAGVLWSEELVAGLADWVAGCTPCDEVAAGCVPCEDAAGCDWVASGDWVVAGWD